MLEAHGLTRRYQRRVTALDGVTLRVPPRTCLGVIGPSGSGKSTLARCLVGLERPDAGELRLDGRPLSRSGKEERRRWSRGVQLIWQDPRAALSPFIGVGRSIGEALEARGMTDRVEREARAATLLARVGLEPTLASRRPAGLSGGQCQRVVIARALAAEPDYLVCDEPLSALDSTTQAQILDLITELAATTGMAVVMISHDLQVVRQVAGEVVVMADGRIVETGPVAVLDDPRHAVTRALRTGELPDPGF